MFKEFQDSRIEPGRLGGLALNFPPGSGIVFNGYVWITRTGGMGRDRTIEIAAFDLKEDRPLTKHRLKLDQVYQLEPAPDTLFIVYRDLAKDSIRMTINAPREVKVLDERKYIRHYLQHSD